MSAGSLARDGLLAAAIAAALLAGGFVALGEWDWLYAGPILLAPPLFLATFRRGVPDSRRFLAIYLGMLAWQFVHAVEETIGGGFAGQAPEPENPAAQSLHFLLDAGYVLGGIGLLLRVRALGLFVCLLFLRSLLNGVGHPLLSLRALAEGGGLYTTGLLTGTLHIVFAVLLAREFLAARSGHRG